MNHQHIIERLDAYLDGELSGTEAAVVAAHLPSCASCRDYAEDWQTLRSRLSSPPPQVSEAFTARVMQAIEPEPAFEWRIAFRWALPTLAFMLAALFFVYAWPADGLKLYESGLLGEGSPHTIQQVALHAESDWTGLEAL